MTQPLAISRRTGALLLIPCLALLGGCATKKKLRSHEEEIAQLKRQITTLQRDQEDQRAQAEQVRNQLFILHDRLETTETRLSRTTQAPPKLEVVKLVPQDVDPLTARVKRARTVTPDPVDIEGYDPSADEAEMFSFSGDDARAALRSDTIRLEAPGSPNGSPVGLTPAGAPPVPEGLADTSTARPKEDPMVMYQRAFSIFQAKNFGDATVAFADFVRANPSHEYADKAYYWMGECYYGQTEYALAIGEFQKVPELYPGGNKVPDALLKIALSYVNLNNPKNAERTFRQLMDAYPQSDAAGLAKKKLAKLSQ